MFCEWHTRPHTKAVAQAIPTSLFHHHWWYLHLHHTRQCRRCGRHWKVAWSLIAQPVVNVVITSGPMYRSTYRRWIWLRGNRCLITTWILKIFSSLPFSPDWEHVRGSWYGQTLFYGKIYRGKSNRWNNIHETSAQERLVLRAAGYWWEKQVVHFSNSFSLI